MVQYKKSAPVIWSASTLQKIGKPDYSGVAAARSATGGRGTRQKAAGGKQ